MFGKGQVACATVVVFGALCGTASAAAVNPTELTLDHSSGLVYVADPGSGVIERFNSDGTRIANFPAAAGTGDGQIGAVAGLSTSPDGDLWVLDTSNKVQEFKPDGTYVRKVQAATCNRASNSPLDGGIDATGQYVVVASACSDQLIRFDRSTLANKLAVGLSHGGGVSYNPYASASGYTIAVTRPSFKDVLLFNDSLVKQRQIAVGGTDPDVYLEDYGNVYVTDIDRDVVHLYGNGGSEYRTLGRPGSAAGSLNDPQAIDAFGHSGDSLDGNIFIADFGNQRWQRWDTYGYTFSTTPTSTDAGTGGGGTGGGGTGAPVGVTINGGTTYVRSTSVTLTIHPPSGATGVVISNDGGFANAQSKSISADATYAWTLPTSGSERLPKTVYVRFTGTGNDSQTFTDDVILDQTAPTQTTATASGGTGATSRLAGAKTGPITTLHVHAKDGNSGPAFVSVARSPKAAKYTVRYTSVKAIKVRGVGPAPYVRVTDHAGNVGKWVRATRAGAKKKAAHRG